VHTGAEAVVLPELRENCGVRLLPCTPQMDSGNGLTAITEKNAQITVPNAESSNREWPILKRPILRFPVARFYFFTISMSSVMVI
jgi:hypothetical protein